MLCSLVVYRRFKRRFRLYYQSIGFAHLSLWRKLQFYLNFCIPEYTVSHSSRLPPSRYKYVYGARRSRKTLLGSWTSVVRLGYKRRKFLPYFMLPAGHISHNLAASAAAKWATNLSRVCAEMLATSWSL